jgi:FAD/FMN-containing dehydrogenase
MRRRHAATRRRAARIARGPLLITISRDTLTEAAADFSVAAFFLGEQDDGGTLASDSRIRPRLNRVHAPKYWRCEMTKKRHQEFVNWSGSLRFTPEVLAKPKSEKELATLVHDAAAAGRTVRVVGTGHSSMPLVETREVLVSLEKMKGLVSYDCDRSRATILPGMTVGEAGKALLDVGLAMHNTGDVDIQLLSGAISTGTHGSGFELPNLAWMLAGMRLVTGTGEVREYSVDTDPEFMNAARVSLGTLGIFSALTLQLCPAYTVKRREYFTTVDPALEHLDELIHGNRRFDMYWYPRSDEIKLRTANEVGRGMEDIPWAKRVKDEEGWVSEVLPRHRDLRFDEMEYALPAEAGLACWKEVRKRVRKRHRQYVAWRVFFRTVAADETWLSPFYQRQSVTIAILQNVGLEYWSYFKDIEPIFRDHGGRPHWGKKHTLKAPELRPLYPRWDDFQRVRSELDPGGTYLNSYVKELFGL